MNLDKVRVQFVSKAPHDTIGLKVWASAAEPPLEMFSVLCKLGWKQSPWFAPTILAKQCPDRCYAQDDTTPVIEHFFELGGTGVFNSWTSDESKKNMASIRSAMRKFGFIRIPHHKLTLAECL